MQTISNDQTGRSDTVQDLKDFSSLSLATQAKNGEQLLSMVPATEKAFDLMADDIVEFSTENDALKNRIGSYDEKWLGESKAKPLKQIDDENGANSIMANMEKQMKKHGIIDIYFFIINYLKRILIILSLENKSTGYE